MTSLTVVSVAKHTDEFPNFSQDDDPGFFVFANDELLLGWFPIEEAANLYLGWIERIREHFGLPEWLPGTRLPGPDSAPQSWRR